MREGIITGADQNQEWILPWWWEHYSSHNSYPVCFIDFGLSERARKWCEKRGEVIPLSFPSFHLSKKDELPAQIVQAWERRYGIYCWEIREAWLKKPFALLQAPFEHSLWLDVDCQVRGDLAPLFQILQFGIDLGMVRDEADAIEGLTPEEIPYNGGVIAFRKEAPILEKWTEGIVQYQHLLAGDTEVLARVIHREKPLFLELSALFNWPRTWGENPKTVIHHYFGKRGKEEILNQIGPENFLKIFES